MKNETKTTATVAETTATVASSEKSDEKKTAAQKKKEERAARIAAKKKAAAEKKAAKKNKRGRTSKSGDASSIREWVGKKIESGKYTRAQIIAEFKKEFPNAHHAQAGRYLSSAFNEKYSKRYGGKIATTLLDGRVRFLKSGEKQRRVTDVKNKKTDNKKTDNKKTDNKKTDNKKTDKPAATTRRSTKKTDKPTEKTV